MTIETRDGIVAALASNSDRFLIDKASLANTVAGQLFSLWTSTGVPAAGAAPTTAAVPTNATTGAISFGNQTAPATSYIDWAWAAFSNAPGSVEIHDRLAHMGGLSGRVTTAQGALDLTTTNPGADRIGATDYSDVQWWLEVYTAMGTAASATVGVTYNDGTTGNLTAFTLGATPRQGRLYPLLSAVGGKFIRGVTGVTLSADTGTVGNFGITATRSRTVISSLLANSPVEKDWAQLGHPEIPNNSCLQMIMLCSTTSTGTVRGAGKITHG